MIKDSRWSTDTIEDVRALISEPMDFKNWSARDIDLAKNATKRAILALYARQTESEQYTETTSESNGVGFNGVDAPFMSSLAGQLQSGRQLSEKQLTYARKILRKYARQVFSTIPQSASVKVQAVDENKSALERAARAIDAARLTVDRDGDCAYPMVCTFCDKPSMQTMKFEKYCQYVMEQVEYFIERGQPADFNPDNFLSVCKTCAK